MNRLQLLCAVEFKAHALVPIPPERAEIDACAQASHDTGVRYFICALKPGDRFPIAHGVDCAGMLNAGQEPGPKDAPNNRSTPEAAPTGEALTDEQEREAFEAWAQREGVDTTLWMEHTPKAGWLNGRTADYWTGWLARAALSAHPSAPVAPADVQEDAARWRALPAFLEDHQINYVGLMRDIDLLIASERAIAPAAPAVQPASVLPPLPSPVDQERVYGGHGNEVVHLYFSETQMREYARQSVYLTDEALRLRVRELEAQLAAAVQPVAPAGWLRVGWWVVFDEANDEGEIPGGFCISDKRAETFASEPGWLKNRLIPLYASPTAQPATDRSQP